MDWVAVASVVSSAGVAIYTVWKTTLNAARDREHDREMAQEARRQERRGTTYVEVLTALHHLMTAIDRTSPILVVGKPPDPPPPPGDPELWRLNALTAAFASRDRREPDPSGDGCRRHGDRDVGHKEGLRSRPTA